MYPSRIQGDRVPEEKQQHDWKNKSNQDATGIVHYLNQFLAHQRSQSPKTEPQLFLFHGCISGYLTDRREMIIPRLRRFRSWVRSRQRPIETVWPDTWHLTHWH